MENYCYISNNIETAKKVKKFLKDEKRAEDIFKFLLVSGDFKDNLVNLNLIEKNKFFTKDNKNNGYTFYAEPYNITSKNIITKINNEEKRYYDLSIGNLNKLNKENVELLRINDLIDFNGLSLTTDSNTYYNIIDKNNKMIYQTLVEFDSEPLNKNEYFYQIIKEGENINRSIGFNISFIEACQKNNVTIKNYKYSIYYDMDKTLEIGNNKNIAKKRTL